MCDMCKKAQEDFRKDLEAKVKGMDREALEKDYINVQMARLVVMCPEPILNNYLQELKGDCNG